jgi:hypothetical protein
LSSRLKRHAPELLLAVVFVALVAPVIAVHGYGPAGAEDELRYHNPTIVLLALELPHPDLVHLHTATSPGFHLVVAVFARLVTYDIQALEAFAALFSLAMVLVAYRLLSRFLDRWLALLATLPLLLSHYVLQSAGWLNTDNAAVLFVVLAIGAALRIEHGEPGFARGGAYVLLATWIRQPAIWTAGPFVAAAALAGRLVPGLSAPGPRSLRPVVKAGLALVPAVATLAVFAAIWGQLTPPAFAKQSGTSPAAIPFTLALAGVFGGFFAVWSARRDDLVRGRAPLLAAAGALALALAAPTSETSELQARTGGGLWKVVENTPVVADRSLAIAVLAPLGAVLLVALWRAAAREGRRAQATVALVAIASLACAQAGTVRTYQRYFEPILLVMLALLAALGPIGARDADPALRRRALVSLGLLCGLQLAGCVAVVYTAVL